MHEGPSGCIQYTNILVHLSTVAQECSSPDLEGSNQVDDPFSQTLVVPEDHLNC